MASTPNRPNIVIIIADHVAFSGHYQVDRYPYSWPHLEHLAKQGARFERAYAVTPICTPSRASLLTGKRADKHGLRWNCEYPIAINRRDFRDDEQLYSHYLTQAGYDNYYCGKWHCGVKKTAKDYGMIGWSLAEYGNVYTSKAYTKYLKKIAQPIPTCRIDHHLLKPELDGTEVLMQPKTPWDYMDAAGVLSGEAQVHEQFFIADMAKDYLNIATDKYRQTQKPFSLIVSMWGPHHPYFPSKEFAEKINPKDIPPYPSHRDDLGDKPWRYHLQRDLCCQHRALERWNDWQIWQTVLARCYASGLQTDAAIHSIDQHLQQLGLADNCLFIVTADHGDGIAAHAGGWDKYSAFTEEVAKVPLVMRWPKTIQPATRIDSLVNLMDVNATILDAATIDTTADYSRQQHQLALDGESLLPFITGERHRDTMICEHYGHSGDLCFQKILYRQQWKYVAAWNDGDELYDLATDPYQRNNLIADPATQSRQHSMRETIIKHLNQRRQQRNTWHPAEYWEDGIVTSSPEWPREERLLLYKLEKQQENTAPDCDKVIKNTTD